LNKYSYKVCYECYDDIDDDDDGGDDDYILHNDDLRQILMMAIKITIIIMIACD
jgi:hypothetical protein